MFCHKCGAELPDDSQFCRKCGQSLSQPQSVATGSAAAAAPAPQPAQVKRKPFWRYYVLGVVVIVLLLGWFINRADQRQRSTYTPPAPPPPQVHRTKIGTGAITVNAGTYSYFTLTVPAEAANVKLQGHFTASGGSGNDIEAYVLSQDQYTNWQNGHATSTFYNSGKVTAGEIEAALPAGAGTYYLIFDNKFSLLTPKAVQEDMTLAYTTSR